MSAPEPALLAACRERRARVLQQLRAAGGGVAILPTAPEAMRNRDSDYPYRHDSHFYYLSAFTEPEAVLVLVAGAEAGADRSIPFCRPKHEEREIWDGFRYGPEGALAAFGFDEAHSVEELDARLPALLADRAVLAYPLAASSRIDRRAALARCRARAVALGCRGAGHRAGPAQRARRNAPVQGRGRAGGDAPRRRDLSAGSRAGHAHQPRRPARVPPEAELLYEFRRHGAQSVAYNSIVATGANACVLHYRAGPAELRVGDLCLIDAGCELDGYASDITRTFPVSGRFSAAQRELYDPVLAAQEAAIAETRAGVPYNVPHDAAVRVLAQGMLDTGLLDRNRKARWTTCWPMAATAASICTAPATGSAWTCTTWANTACRAGRGRHRAAVARAGARHGADRRAGIYVRPAEDVPERYWHIGIRIEDDAVVTGGACELITRGVPVKADEIEALMREGGPR